MTQLELARKGKTTSQMRRIAKDEGMEPDVIRKGVAKGRIVIPHNIRRSISRPCAIGEGLRTKVNANIGTSKDSSSIMQEIEKMDVAVSLGSDTVMDLSTGSGIGKTRKAILAKSPVPVGTVPIYEIAIDCLAKNGDIRYMNKDAILSVLEEQARDGVDFFTIHAGVTRSALASLKKNPRILNIVSRGGAFLAEWIFKTGRENPFYEEFDAILEIARRHDVTLSLGDGLRPGSVYDATDTAQLAELITLGALRRRAVKAGVQVMIEGPGHVPVNQIEANVILEKAICDRAPFYVLGPLVTDIAPGYDHITAAIGGALAAAAGADFLCYVTPSEHLRLPALEDVRKGVVATKIAAHAADIAKGVRGAMDRDISISKARRARDWKAQFNLAIDPARPSSYRKMSKPGKDDVCTMCSDYCSIKISEECFKIN